MRASQVSWLPLLVAICAPASAEDPAGLVAAREAVDACRGKAHADLRRVVWTQMDDEAPPDGAEVVLIRGFIGYEMTRFVVRGTAVEARSVLADRSWFYNQEKGESFSATAFDVEPATFARAWNAARRIRAARDERIATASDVDERFPRGFRSHESVDWIRVCRRAGEDEVHAAGRQGSSLDDANDDWVWRRVRDAAIFHLFARLVPEPNGRRPAAGDGWRPFATAEVRRATAARLDPTRRSEAGVLLETCLRVLGHVGDDGSAEEAAALRAVLENDAASGNENESMLEECRRSETRMRLRLHWDREDAIRTLRSIEFGTWARGDQAKWIRSHFRQRDPAGWAAFLVEEVSRPDARRADVEAAAADLRGLPASVSVPLLRKLLGSPRPEIRVEAALALHDVEPKDPAAAATVVAVALDRSIRCTWRADLTNYWCRSKALVASMDWGGLTLERLRQHVADPRPDDMEFLDLASYRFPSPAGVDRYHWTPPEILAAWRRVLDEPPSVRIRDAVWRLQRVNDTASVPRMRAALQRVLDAIRDGKDVGIGADVIQRFLDSCGELEGGPGEAK